MSSLQQIKAGIKSLLQAEVPGLNVYGDVPDVTQVPAVVVLPATPTAGGMACDFGGAFGRGLDTWNIDLYVLAARTETTLGQQKLDAFITGTGPKSLRRIFYENATLGLPDTDAHPEGIRNYGGNFASAGVEHVGAVLRLMVRTSSA